MELSLCIRNAVDFVNKDDFQTAIVFLEKALTIDPSSLTAKLLIATCLIEQGCLLDAYKYAHDIISADKGNPMAWELLKEISTKQVTVLTGRNDEELEKERLAKMEKTANEMRDILRKMKNSNEKINNILQKSNESASNVVKKIITNLVGRKLSEEEMKTVTFQLSYKKEKDVSLSQV